jgi:molybdate transport system regulatory protein
MGKVYQLKYKIWIESNDGESLLGEGKWQLLKAIKHYGSLQLAVRKMGYSYRQTWSNLKKIEEKLGFQLIEKHRGGEMGGKTVLTQRGEELVSFFDELYQQSSSGFSRYLVENEEKLNMLLLETDEYNQLKNNS